MKEGELDESNDDIPKKMLEFAKARISEYRIEDVYVMDIAQIGNGYKLIECNCFNGTGFYMHDIENIIQSINKLIRKKIEKETCG